MILKNNIKRTNNNNFEINTINYNKKIIIFFYIKKKYNNSFDINYTKKISTKQTIIFLLLIP
jgi:hypothetical protein